MTSTPVPTPAHQKVLQADDDIDLKQIAESLQRQKKVIIGFAFASLLFSALFAFTRKPVWEGRFQIVLEKDLDRIDRLSQLAASTPLIANAIGIGDKNQSQLKTEVQILKSPSVLKTTYDFVKFSKTKNGENVENWSFRQWRDDSLIVELDKGTSVLNIAYQDTDSRLVLPVIKKISNDYQEYSGRARSKSINNALAFVEKQVEKFRRQAKTSSRNLDAFSIRYGITSSGGSVVSTSINVNRMLSQHAISTPPGDFNKQYNSHSVQKQRDPYEQLAGINQELIRRKQRFTNRDPGVLALIRERDALRDYIELTAGGSLTLPGQQPTSKEQAQGLILTFQELKRTAKRDIDTLSRLEGSLLSLQLEQAKQNDPWELISTPTLLDKPVAPKKIRIIGLGFIGGILIGCVAGLIKDRRSGLIYSEKELCNMLHAPLLGRLRMRQTNDWKICCELIANGPLFEARTIALIPVGQPEIKAIESLSKVLQTSVGERSMLVSKNLMETRNCDTQLLIVQPGNCTREQLNQLEQNLAMQGTTVSGWLLMDPEGAVA